MEFRIAESFIDSLVKLTARDQKAVKTAAFDLQLNPANPGIRLHRVNRVKEKNFWSGRVNRDIRFIVYRQGPTTTLCFADHHDGAYSWAARHVIERHPRTGAAQLVELRKTVREIENPWYVAAPSQRPAPKPALLAHLSDDELLSFGVPTDWLQDVRTANEDSLLDLAEHLPAEAAEAILVLATGGTPKLPAHAPLSQDAFAHPDAQRRFRVMANSEELGRALDYPREKWSVFLHPAQRALVERHFEGPARVAGSAGTGKTVVALHRAFHLARSHPGDRVLLTTLSDTLANSLRTKLVNLSGGDAAVSSRIDVRALDPVVLGIYEAQYGRARLVDESVLQSFVEESSDCAPKHRFGQQFIEKEWRDVVDAWQIFAWDEYREVPRLGRKTRIGPMQRAALWSIFESVRLKLDGRGLQTLPAIYSAVTEHLASTATRPYEFVVVDESQDLSVPQLRFLAGLQSARKNGLFFAGDLGQRIFQTPFSWLSLGVDVRGRSNTLRINYRTSHQIRRQADLLLPPELSDVDGNADLRRGTISAFNGPAPTISVVESVKEEIALISEWLNSRIMEGIEPEDIGVFVRVESLSVRAKAAVRAAGLEFAELDGSPARANRCVSIGSMHSAKGLEFRAVVVSACDDEVIPLQSRIESLVDEGDLEDVYDTERHLLYVACTRARDHLLVSGVEPASEFLEDLQSSPRRVESAPGSSNRLS